MKTTHKILIGSLIVLALIAGINLGVLLNAPQIEIIEASVQPKSDPTLMLGQKRPDFKLFDLENRLRSINEWDGKALLINFWATWCEPCREEIPLFQKIRAEYQDQFEIIGVALDLPDLVAEMRAELDIEYPLLFGQEDADQVMRDYGHATGTLPYSVFVDSDGIVRHIHDRSLKEDNLRQILGKILPNNDKMSRN